MPKNVTIGIFGFGCVGQGLYKVLSKTHGIQAEIKKICIKDPNKPRSIDSKYFITDPAGILDDPQIDVVVELIDDPDAAFQIVTKAMESGKAVVSANKKMIADNLEELYRLQQVHNVPFLYEASSCASIPIIRNLEEYYDNDLITGVEGIFNGSTNYILSSLFNNGTQFSEALTDAQEKGFAESDPTLDIEGFDPKYKLCILLLHAFGLFVKPEEIVNLGISKINASDINYAKQIDAKIKLVATCQKNNTEVKAIVGPQFVRESSQLYNIENEYNAVDVETVFSETQLFVGKGAGDEPTGSAVLSDISALTYGYRYEYKKVKQEETLKLSSDIDLKIYLRYRDEKPDSDLFNDISEEYVSPHHKFIIGSLSLNSLLKSDILERPDVSIIQV